MVGNLVFLALLTGILLAAAVNIFNNKYYFNQLQANNNRPFPEARLPPMMVGGIAFTAGLFLFACMSKNSISSWFLRTNHDMNRDFEKKDQPLAFYHWHRFDWLRIHDDLSGFPELLNRYIHSL